MTESAVVLDGVYPKDPQRCTARYVESWKQIAQIDAQRALRETFGTGKHDYSPGLCMSAQ